MKSQAQQLYARVRAVLESRSASASLAPDREASSPSEERFRRLAENTHEMLGEWDEAGRCVWVSPSVERLLGVSQEEFARDPYALVHPDDVAAAAQSMRRRLESGASGVATFRLRDANGFWHWFDSTSNVVVTREGARRVVTVSRDVTERRALELQLRQAQKMEAVGQLAGGVAHDFNNLLTVIQGYCELLRESLLPDSPEAEAAEEIRGATARAAELTEQLLAYGRRHVMRPQRLSINDVLLEMEGVLRKLVGASIELDVSRADGVGDVRFDRGQLEQVILNLVLNARDAMPDGGRLAIQTGDIEAMPESAIDRPEALTGPAVALRVVDDGVGMDADIQLRVFEPFFTTKETGHGTGLGLSMVYGIVHQGGGDVSVSSARGVGTEVTIRLPRLAPMSRTAEAEIPAQPEVPRGDADGSVLLVEDEDRVRRVLARTLTQAGYRVVAASTAAQALELAGRAEAEFDLLLTDVVMPRMSGVALAEQLVRAQPGIKLLFITGYAEHTTLRSPLLDPARNLLTKPFAPEILTQKVREILEPGGVSTEESR